VYADTRLHTKHLDHAPSYDNNDRKMQQNLDLTQQPSRGRQLVALYTPNAEPYRMRSDSHYVPTQRFLERIHVSTTAFEPYT
jgi:hypothetical protein